MRFLTVPDARAARRSIGWAVGLIGVFYVFVAVIGLGGRAILGDEGVKLGGKSGNLLAPYLAQHLGGGPGSTGGDVFFAVISAVAFNLVAVNPAGVGYITIWSGNGPVPNAGNLNLNPGLTIPNPGRP
jgi:cation/acetate symporter